jgi:peptidoglycan hydrolase CwlO-like protein
LGKYAVKVLSQPNFGSDRLAKAAFLKDMLMNKAIPPTAAVIALLADLMEIPGGQKLIDEIQKDTGAQSQLAQLAKQMKDMQGKLKRLDSDNTKLMKELEIADFRNDLDKTHRDIKDKAKERIDSIIPEGDGQ